MKKTKSKKGTRTRTVIYIIVPLLLLFTGMATWYSLRHRVPSPTTSPAQSDTQRPEVNKIDYSPAKESDNIANENAKEQLTTSGTDSGSASTNSVTVTITTAKQQDDTVLIRTLIEGATSGTCTLTASKPGQTSLTRSAPVTTQAHYALCQGFNIAAIDFPTSGTWTIQASLSTEKGSTSSKTTTVEVQK